MDLDKIKETWKNTELPSTSIDEKRIQHILDSRGTSALEKLIKYEKWGLFGLVFCLFISPIFGLTHLAFTLIYSICCMIGFAWQFHKYELLKSIDLERMDLIAVSIKFTKYSSYISKELIIGLLWLLFFLSSYIGYKILKSDDLTARLSHGDISIILTITIPIIVALVVCLWLYKTIYLNNIKAVKESIAELKSFEEEEEE